MPFQVRLHPMDFPPVRFAISGGRRLVRKSAMADSIETVSSIAKAIGLRSLGMRSIRVRSRLLHGRCGAPCIGHFPLPA